MEYEYMEKRTQEKEDLQNIRVLQRNLVYVVGIPVEFAREELLRSKRLFGGYGDVVKIVLSKRKEIKTEQMGENPYSAYITYSREEYAIEAIREMDGGKIGEKTVRCTFGTTKYCSYFLRGVKCGNEGCLYLHEKGKDEDSFSRDQMSVLKSKIDKMIEKKTIQSRMEDPIEGIEELRSLFQFKPVQEKQKYYENCHFNPFYRKSSEDASEKTNGIYAENN